MDTSAYIAIGIFLVTYVLIVSEKIHKTVAALLGAMAMILVRVVDEEEAYLSIDLEVIFLLAGMMVMVHFLAESGFFEYVAVWLAKAAKGRPLPLFLSLCVATAVLSAAVDNVTTVLLIAPVTFLIAQQLEVSPVPFLIFEALASNIGGTSTLIGDPPNILIAGATGLTFNQFIFHLAPIAIVCLLLLLGVAALLFGKRFHVPADIRARILEMEPGKAIRVRGLLIKSGAVVVLTLIGFVLHGVLHVSPATLALAGAALILVLTRAEPEKAFHSVEWPTLFFFIGLFMVTEGLVATGVLDRLARLGVEVSQNDLLIASMLVLWFSAIASAFVDNIPLVVTLIPVIHSVVPTFAAKYGDTQLVEHALWWPLALGACLGGNGTIIGASANVVAVEIARKNGAPITFWQFFSYGMPVMLLTIAVSSVYVLFRYIF